MTKFILFADESQTHQTPPLRRYWCFFGALAGFEKNIDRFITDIKKLRAAHNFPGEIAWKNINAKNIDFYKKSIDIVFDHIAQEGLIYRQIFCDRAHIPLDRINDPTPFDLDFQYKLYYQFIKHSFGLTKLPANAKFILRLDHHSSKKHQVNLQSFATNISNYIGRPDIAIDVNYVSKSTKHEAIQFADLIAGAAGSHANKSHLVRRPGQRGQTPKQKLRHELAKHIYSHLREMRRLDVGSNVFNWFSTTGGFSHENALKQRVRVWKFEPKRPYYKDKGWENDHLDSQGNYQGPDIIKIT